MIQISRGKEPAKLVDTRDAALELLRRLGRNPASRDIDGYRIVADELWQAQHFKCCYCEAKVTKSYNDVEHYRPKAAANRNPGCNLTHGYWWLAFTWTNLLFACSLCNRSGKNDSFPLAHGSVSLQPEEHPDGNEIPLLLDPSMDNPMEHIQYVFKPDGRSDSASQWVAVPRKSSIRGGYTILTCDLNNKEFKELRCDYVDNYIYPRARSLLDEIEVGNIHLAQREFDKALALISPNCAYVALAYDALNFFVPDSSLAVINRRWPTPSQMGVR